MVRLEDIFLYFQKRAQWIFSCSLTHTYFPQPSGLDYI